MKFFSGVGCFRNVDPFNNYNSTWLQATLSPVLDFPNVNHVEDMHGISVFYWFFFFLLIKVEGSTV